MNARFGNVYVLFKRKGNTREKAKFMLLRSFFPFRVILISNGENLFKDFFKKYLFFKYLKQEKNVLSNNNKRPTTHFTSHLTRRKTVNKILRIHFPIFLLFYSFIFAPNISIPFLCYFFFS